MAPRSSSRPYSRFGQTGRADKQAGHQRIETLQHYVDLGHGLLDSRTHLLPAFFLGEG